MTDHVTPIFMRSIVMHRDGRGVISDMGSLAVDVDCALPTANPKLFAISRDFGALLFR